MVVLKGAELSQLLAQGDFTVTELSTKLLDSNWTSYRVI